jgi:mannose-6-phosphate isomerase-like protein (cupin superfamily)
MTREDDSFDPATTALYLEDGGRAQALPLDENFWRDLSRGAIAADHGWLTMVLPMSGDTVHWEMHPEGEELLYAQSGAFIVVMETPQGERHVRLDRKTPAFVMPRGTWHRFEVEQPGDIVFATYGRGTQHKPV